MHLVWKQKKGSSVGAGPRRGDDVFGEGMILGFSERFVSFLFKNNSPPKKMMPYCNWHSEGDPFLPKAENSQLGRLLSGWLSAGYRSQRWQATSQNREPR